MVIGEKCEFSGSLKGGRYILIRKLYTSISKRNQSLKHAIETYENFYQESLGSSSTQTPLPSVSPRAEPKPRQDHPKLIPPQPRVSTNVEETTPITLSKNHPFPQRNMREDALPTSRPHLQPTASVRGRASNAPTILTSATNTTPITREAGRLDALNTAQYMLGRCQEPFLVMPVTMPRTPVVCTQTIPDRRDSARSQPLSTLPVGVARPIPNDVIWPEHPDIRGRDLLPLKVADQELPQELTDSTERWRLLQPYEQRGTLNPSADIPGHLRRLVESEELVESLQIMEYLMDHPPLGSRQDYQRYPPRYGDPYYHHVGPRRSSLGEPCPYHEKRDWKWDILGPRLELTRPTDL